jgi:predicted ATP-dependent endonuclease of OLD family
MKLKKVHINEFQSIRDSNPFEIGDITCLVGKNEAGKTAVLQALYRLNPLIESEGEYDVTDDYPRSDVEDYQQGIENGSRKPAIVVQATFALDPEDLEDFENDFGKGILKHPGLTLSKGYENKLYVGLDVNEKLAIESFIKAAQVPEELSSSLLGCSSIKEFAEKLDKDENAENKEHIKKLKASIQKVKNSDDLIHYFYDTYLKGNLPKFLYFDEYYQLRGHENLEALINRVQQNKLQKSDYPLLGLIELARLELKELLNPERTQWLVNKLEGASNHLSKKILNYWSQNKHLDMRFDVRPGRPGDPEGMKSGNNLWASVYDTKHKVTTLLGTRSRGFVWFFSFLAWFDQQQRKQQPFILLLDEPGLFLHGKAQGDLLNYMEKELKGHHQVIYTTHSPFMVDPQRFHRVRIVQNRSMDLTTDSSDDGTKVFEDVLEATDDSLFPLQGALGYEIHQTLFVGPNCLVVEGVSDFLFLQTISGVLESIRRIGLDHRWTITPVGGSEKVPTFVALLGAQSGLNVATLIDIQKKAKQTIENLYKKKLLKKKNVLTYADFVETAEADVEDMFTPSLYISFINAEYSAQMNSAIDESQLNNRLPRIVLRLEEYFKNNPLKDGLTFNHYRPARYFAERIRDIKQSIPDIVLKRFEDAFKALNSLL